jgi:hypothetical protein
MEAKMNTQLELFPISDDDAILDIARRAALANGLLFLTPQAE